VRSMSSKNRKRSVDGVLLYAKGERFLFIASEIGDRESDGIWIEALPYQMIKACKVIDRIAI
jgi:hypothetical protein